MQAVGARLAGQQVRGEESGLQQDIGGALAHGGSLPAHDAGDGQRARLIGDDQGIGLQLHLLAVQQFQGLTGSAPRAPRYRR